jgi:pimeloyl-ACP methyl ester carboxylesterase
MLSFRAGTWLFACRHGKCSFLNAMALASRFATALENRRPHRHLRGRDEPQAVRLAAEEGRVLRRGSTPTIDKRVHPNGLATLEEIPVNGTRQWVLIRSENITHPLLLFVHGGPGTSQLALIRRVAQPLEKYFTVVNWDQRGAGKSFAAGRDRGSMTIRQFVDDTLAVSAYLASRFDKKQVAIVGHSWGTVIAMLAVHQRPELFSTYIGIGQVANSTAGEALSYRWTLDQAQRAGDARSSEALLRIGPPPYVGRDWRSKFLTQRRLLGQFGGEYYKSRVGAFGVVLKNLVFSREYTLIDRINFFRGIYRSLDALHEELSRVNLFATVSKVEVPVYFCLGRHDHEVPSSLSAEYFEVLKAPSKQLVWFERSAHLPNVEERAAFNGFMLKTVLPTLGDENPTERRIDWISG